MGKSASFFRLRGTATSNPQQVLNIARPTISTGTSRSRLSDMALISRYDQAARLWRSDQALGRVPGSIHLDGRLGGRHQAHPVFSVGCGFDDAAAVCGPHGRDDRLGGAGTMRYQHCFGLAKGGIRADGNLAGRGPLSAALPILRGVYADFAGALGDREKRLQSHSFKWTTAASNHCRPKKLRLSAPARASRG